MKPLPDALPSQAHGVTEVASTARMPRPADRIEPVRRRSARPGETAEALRGGWVHTGDCGWMDDDGYACLADRRT
jgi:acyl-CoA synthetase (AMP-forming)/AMP-acid ligase II